MKVRQIPAEVYSRVSGYFRPVGQWNKGKQEEFGERKKAIIKGDEYAKEESANRRDR